MTQARAQAGAAAQIMTTNTERLAELAEARAPVDAWIQRVAPEAWLARRDHPWTRKDLLGHLTAWSDFLLDQVDALLANRPDTIAAVEIDAWNAAEAERRRHWTVEATIAAWQESARRAEDVVAAVPPEAWDGRWRVAWAGEPVSIAGVLGLMMVHVRQHQAELERDT